MRKPCSILDRATASPMMARHGGSPVGDPRHRTPAMALAFAGDRTL